MIGDLTGVVVGAVLVGVGRYVWRLVFPPPGRFLFVVDAGDEPASVEVDGEAPALVHALGDAFARYLREHDRGEWPAAIVVEVMPRPR